VTVPSNGRTVISRRWGASMPEPNGVLVELAGSL
jgi:hypothetical protein